MANGPTNAALTLQPGAMISPTLRLVRPLAVGGMGSVWVADHLAFRTHVVVKFMSEALASNADALARFSREAAAASQVKSPHVVHMIEHGVTNAGVPFIAMEMLDGRDLRHLLDERRTLEPELVSNVVSQVARALMAANQRGIVHRDIKPENIFLTDAGGGDLFVKVLDFGIAKATTGEMSRSTGTGAMLGTPSYMSPEQILGQKTIDFRSDLWALGIVAYEALTGSVPFDGETVGAISVAICSGQAPAMSQRAPQLGPAFDAWFARACAREPSHRFSSAKEMADALAVTVSGFGDEATTLLARPLHSGALDADASSRVQVPITNVSLPAVPTTTPSSARQLTTGGASSTTTAQADGASVARPKRFANLLSGGIKIGRAHV